MSIQGLIKAAQYYAMVKRAQQEYDPNINYQEIEFPIKPTAFPDIPESKIIQGPYPSNFANPIPKNPNDNWGVAPSSPAFRNNDDNRNWSSPFNTFGARYNTPWNPEMDRFRRLVNPMTTSNSTHWSDVSFKAEPNWIPPDGGDFFEYLSRIGARQRTGQLD